MSHRLHPCKYGPGCTRSAVASGGCPYFHGKELIKSGKPCHYGDACHHKKTCVWLHDGERHLIGKVFWRAAQSPAAGGGGGAAPTPRMDRWQALAAARGAHLPPARPPASTAVGGGAAGGGAAAVVAAEEDPLRTPAPLDDYAVLDPLKNFLKESDYIKLRAVNKSLKAALDTHLQITSITITEAAVGRVFDGRARLPCLDYVKKITFSNTDGRAYFPPVAHVESLVERLSAAPRVETLILSVRNIMTFVPLLARLRTLKRIYINRVDMSGQDDVWVAFTAAIRGHPHIEKLKIYPYLSSPRLQGILAALPDLPRLKSLGFACAADSELEMYQPLARCAQLKSLEIMGGSSVAFNMLAALPLTKLNLNSVRFLDRHLAPVSQWTASDKNFGLKKLTILNPNIYEHPEKLNLVTARFPNLESLNISSCHYYAYYNGEHGWPWEKLTKLKELTVGSNDFHDDVMPSFCSSLPAGLEQLFMHGIAATQATHLIAALSRLNLWSLGLNGNSFEDPAGLAAAIVESCPKLQQLGFTLPTLTSETAKKAVTSLSALPELRHIYFYATGGYRMPRSITDKCVAEMRQILGNKNTILVHRPDLSTHVKTRF